MHASESFLLTHIHTHTRTHTNLYSIDWYFTHHNSQTQFPQRHNQLRSCAQAGWGVEEAEKGKENEEEENENKNCRKFRTKLKWKLHKNIKTSKSAKQMKRMLAESRKSAEWVGAGTRLEQVIYIWEEPPLLVKCR